MWGEINDWWVHLRTRQGIGAGRDRYRRQYQADVQAVRDYKNQNRSPNSGESQAEQSQAPWSSLVKDPATSWEKFQMEEETERTSSPERKWRMTMNKGQMQTALTKVSDTFAKLDEYGFKDLLSTTAAIANLKLENSVDEWSLAIIMSAFADAKVSQMPERVEAYREFIMWMAIAADLKENKVGQMPRVAASLQEAMSGVNFVEPKQ